MLHAGYENCLKIVTLLVPNFSATIERKSILVKAIQHWDSEEMILCLSDMFESFEFAFELSLEMNRFELTRFFIENSGIDLNKPLSNRHLNAFQFACSVGNFPIVKYLVNQRKISIVDDEQRSWTGALNVAILNGHFEVVEFVLRKGRKQNLKMTGIQIKKLKSFVEKEYDNLTLFKILVEYGKVDLRKDIFFHGILARAYDTELIRYLIDHGADVNGVRFGSTAMSLSCACGNLEALNLLIERGAKADIGEKYPLFSASQLDIIQCLVEKANVDLNVRNYLGQTILHLISKVEIFQYLIGKGANPNLKDDDGDSVLHAVCQSRASESLKLLKFLIEEMKMNPKNRNYRGDTPVHVARRERNYAAIEYFMQKFPKSSKWKNYQGKVPKDVEGSDSYYKGFTRRLSRWKIFKFHFRSFFSR